MSNVGRMFAWGGFVFGALVSVAANVLAARIPPPGVRNWSPSADAQIGSAVWPLALLLSVEVLSRIDWPQTWWSKAIRYGGVGAVALFSAVISYQHIRDVLVDWRYPVLSTTVGPLVIDGLMVVCGYAMVVGGRRSRVENLNEPRPGASKPEPGLLPQHRPASPSPQAPPRPPAGTGGIGQMLKPLEPSPRPAKVNGTKPVQARKSGPSPEEIAAELRAEGTTMTKREIQAKYSVGGLKAQEALNLLKEGGESS